MNKRGQNTIFMIVLLIVVFLATILLLVGGLVTTTMNTALDVDLDMGQVNLQDVNAATFGKFNEMVLINADWWGISLIFGMVLALFLSSYMLRGRFPKWGIILDIFIILFVFLISLYISSTYQILLDALASTGITFLEDYTTKTSMFVLNLPIFIVIIGVIMMILFHSSIPRKSEEKLQEGGLLKGI